MSLFPVPDPPGGRGRGGGGGGGGGGGKNDHHRRTNETVPVPKKWCDTSFFPKSVCQCEIHEACAVHLTGCQGGCSGDSATRLAKFVGCYSKGEGVGDDSCKPDLMAECAGVAGIAGGAEAMTSCAKDKSVYNPIVLEAWQRSQKVQTYPYSTINGKVLPQGISTAQLKKALCHAGAKAAC